MSPRTIAPLKEITVATFEQALQGYIMALTIEGKSPEYTAWLDRRLRKFQDFVEKKRGGPVKLTDLTVADAREFIKHLMDLNVKYTGHCLRAPVVGKLSPETLNGYARGIRSFGSWMASEGFTETHIFQALKPPRVPKVLIEPLSEDEIRKVLLAVPNGNAEGTRNMAILLLFLDTGIRVSELINLRLPDVNFGEGIFRVMGKGRKERDVPMGSATRQALIRYLETARPAPVNPQEERLFLNVSGYPISRNSVEKILQRLARPTKVERLHPHLLRHTFAVRFLINGGDAFSLQKILGHESLEMTQRYVRLASSDVKTKHMRFSPVDNLGIAVGRVGRPKRRPR